MGLKMAKETKKQAFSREKTEEAERIAIKDAQALSAQQDSEDSDNAIDLTVASEGWLVPETKAMRRKAAQMRGNRSDSVERLEYDDLNQMSAQRPYVRSGRIRIPRPFGRKLIEDRQEVIGILNMHCNRRMKKSGVKEKHLAILADVYKEVIFNSHKRKKEDDKIELAGSFIGAKSAGAGEKGVRVSLFAATLGISPLLFMREVLWAADHLYGHAVAGEMNRATWIFGCISLCLMSERELVEFIFRTCKKNGSDELELGELVRLAESFHLANNAFRATFSQQLKDISRDQKEGKVILTLDFFLGIHHKCPMMLYPALRMQELVQRRTLGLYVWGRLIKRLDRYMAKQKAIAERKRKPCCLWAILGLKK